MQEMETNMEAGHDRASTTFIVIQLMMLCMIRRQVRDWYEGCCIEKGLVQGLDVRSAEGHKRWGELVVKDTDGIMHTFKIHVTHQCLISEDVYTLLGNFSKWFSSTSGHAWAVGRQLPGQKFEKVSVFRMDSLEEVNRLKDLNVCLQSRNVLV